MAKMRIFEIARSLQSKNKEIKSGTLVKLLNDNGFDVKGANSNIEDDAIAFLLKTFTNKDADVPAKKETKPKPGAAAAKTKTTGEESSGQPAKPVANKEQENAPKEGGKGNAPGEETRAQQEKTVVPKEKSGGSQGKTAEPEQKPEEPKKKAEEMSAQAGQSGLVRAMEEDTKKSSETEKTDKNLREETKKISREKSTERPNSAAQANSDRRGANNDRRNQGTGNRGTSDSNGGETKSQGNRERRNSNNGDRRNRGGAGAGSGERRNRGNNGDRRGQGDYRNQNGGDRRNQGERRTSNNNGDRRGQNNDRRNQNGNQGAGRKQNNNRSGGERVFERFEKSQSGFDGIKQEQKNSRKRNNKKVSEKGTYKKSSKEEMSRIRNKKDPNRKGAFIKPEPVAKEPEDTIKQITIPESLTIRELAEKMKMPASALVKKLFLQGQVVSLNQDITFEEAEEIALEFDIIAEMEEKVDMVAELLKEDEEPEDKMQKRPPVVCVMGHVDHGKTSLLDAIREENVTSREAGGITQHIGAYVVESSGEKITFLDTPGHEAFTSMRMRGAQSTDIAILVVAADDGVMPQTVEAINHAKAAEVEIIVAINKIDKAGANIERVKQELAEYELIPEDWGGSTVFVPVSAHTKEGIDQLLEMIVLTAEVLELKANPDRKARGIVIEARLDKGRGPVATVLVQKGVLRIGDHVAVGTAHGKVRAMIDHCGERVKTAGPSTPVEILGLNGAPDAGEIFVATESDKEAKQISQAYIDQSKDRLLEETKAKKLSLDGLFNQIQAGNVKDLNLIIKADVQGSVEAVKQSLLKLGNEEVAVRVIHGGVGAINESDVSLASASHAIIIGFNIRPDNTAKEIADRENVDVRLYRVIYDAIEDIEHALKGMLEPIYEEKVIGHVEVRQIFKASGVGTIAGSYVLDGKVQRGCKCRIYRGDDLIFEGDLASLKRFKDDVKEVAAGYECGLVFESFNDIQEEDRVECYIMVEVPRS